MSGSVKKGLDKFAKTTIQQSRSRLTKEKKNASKKLYNSLGYDLSVGKNSFSLTFFMEDYGKFVDEGVRGAGGVRKTTSKFNRRNNKGKLWKVKGKDSRFKFGKSGGISAKHFKVWARSKGLSEYAVAKAVYHQGFDKTEFFTKSFEQKFAKLPDEIVKAFNLDLDDLLKFST